MRTINRTIQRQPGFYNYLLSNHGPGTRNLAVSYQKSNQREAVLKCNLVYLIRCRKNKVYPPFLVKKVDRFYKEQLNRSQGHKGKIDRSKSLLLSSYLSTEIDIVASQLRECRLNGTNINFELHEALPPTLYSTYMESQQQFGSNIYNKNKTRLRGKFDRISEKQKTSMNNIFTTSGVTNLTDLVIPIPVLQLLSLGPKFALRPKKINIKDGFNIIAEINSISYTAKSADVTQLITNECIQALQLEIDKNKQLSPLEYYLHRAYDLTLKFIKEHPNIRLIKTDKTNKVAIVTIEQYNSKMMSLLNDRSTYRTIDTDKTVKIQNGVRKHVNSLVTAGVVSEAAAAKLINAAPTPPRIYGSLKDHKAGAPLRPIVSTINSPGQPLAKFINSILQHAVDNTKYNIKNSFEFLQRIQNVKLRANDILVSFDVVSLFTSVPLDLAITAAMKRWPTITKHTDMPRDLFQNILKFLVIDNNYFLHDDTFYEQTSGLPMGGNLSTVLCDFVLEDLFDMVLPKLGVQPTINFKYVDDIIQALPEHVVPEALRLLNSYNESIQFTVEIESNNKLAFLDLSLLRENQSITTDWYRKSTASDRLISFHSAHPYSMKINIATELLNRALRLSDKRFHTKNIKICRGILSTNHYPEKLISRLVKRALYVVRNPAANTRQATPVSTTTETVTYRRATYIPGFTEKIRRIVSSNINNVRLGLRPPLRVDNVLSSLKAKIPHEQRGAGVYLIPCNNDQHCYIGETKRQLKTRVKEHTKDCNEMKNKKLAAINEIDQITRTRSTSERREPLLKQAMNHLQMNSKTSLVAHLTECDDGYNFSAAKIIHSEPNNYNRKLIESLYINLHGERAVNHKRDTQFLSSCIKATVTKLKSTAADRRGQIS